MDTESFHLFFQAPVGVTILRGANFIVESANQRYLDIVGKKEKDFVGIPLLEALPEIKDQGFTDLLESVLKTRQAHHSNETTATIFRNNKVEKIYINFVYQPIIEKDGTVDRILVVVNEVTDMVEARIKASEAEQRTRLAIAAADIGTFEWDVINETFIYSERSAEIFGFAGQMNLSRKIFSSVIHPDDQEARSKAHREALRSGTLDYECRIVDPNGSVRWVKVSGKVFFSREGSFHKMYGTILDITEQQNVSELLREREDQLRVAMEAAEMGYWNVDPQTNMLVCSERTKELFGLPSTTPVDLQVALDLIHENDRERVIQEIYKAWNRETSGNYEVEYRVVGKISQKERFIRAKGKTYFTPEGVPFRFSGTVQDVTEPTLAKIKLEESELRYRQLISGLPVAIYTVDENGYVKLYNKAAVTLWGREPEIGKDLWCGAKRLATADGKWIVHEECPMAVALKENRAFCAEAIIERPNGEKRFVLAYPEPMHDLNGKLTGAMNVVVDITERNAAENAHEESEARFRLLANFMPQLIWAADPTGNLNYYNQAVYDYSGLTYEQIQNDGWLQIVHPDERNGNARQWIQSVTTGDNFIFEHRFRRHDGEYRWQLSRALPQKDSAGNITMWIGTSTDIHDQKVISEELERRVEERTKDLQQANYALEQSNNELEQFAFAASHDMQEPLRKIQTFITFLTNTENETLSEKGKNYLGKINNASLRMKALIDSLLNYSQLSNYNNTHFVATDLNTILSDVKNDLELIITEKQATVRHDQLPVIDAIPLQMNQLFYNLLSNSLKFSKTGDLPVIHISCNQLNGYPSSNGVDADSPKSSYVMITVGDNGIGFDQRYSSKVFDLFQRLNDKYSYEGTGIGLALCKKVVHNHNGDITAESEEGIGTKFHITLPVRAHKKI